MSARGSLRSPRTVGRENEIAAIGHAIDEAAAGRGTCLFLVGEAGAGKTRLLREAREEAGRRGMVVLAGSVPAVVTPPAFGLLAQTLRSWTRKGAVADAELRSFSQGLRQILPEWPAPAYSTDLSPGQMELLILEGALRLVLAAARDRGALLLLEDLQDADPETLRFLNHVASSIAEEPVLVMGAIRTPEGNPLVEEARTLGRREQATILDVAPLAALEVTALVEEALRAPAPERLIADLVAWTDGVPLLVEEVLETHLAAGMLRREGGAIHWSGGVRAIVPRTILQIVRQKLARLSPAARRTVGAAAVLGRFDADVLVEMAEVDIDDLAHALRSAVDAGLVETTGSELRFRHALIREAVVQTLLPFERTAFHGRAARVIKRLHGSDPDWLEVRAHHLEAVGERDRAAELLVGAARRSLEAHGPASAEAMLNRALALAQHRDMVDGVQDALAETLGVLGRWDEALRLDGELTRRSGAPPARLARMAHNVVRAGRLDEADILIERAASTGADPGPLRALAALVALWRGDVHTAIEAGEEALRLGEAGGDANVTCAALDVLGRARDIQGRREAAAEAFERWAKVADEAGLGASHAQARVELGNLQFLSHGAPDGLRGARDRAREVGAFTTLVLADLSLIWCLGGRGELEEALVIGDEAMDLCRRFGLGLYPHVLQAVGAMHSLRRCDSGEPLIAESLALAGDDPDVLLQAHSLRGESALRAGRFEVAIEHFDRNLAAIRAAPESAVPDYGPSLRVCALVAAGRDEEAKAALAEARALPGHDRLFFNPLLLTTGEALLARSADGLERAVAGLRERTAFYGAAMLVLGAEVIGGPRAEGWLREALELFERAGAETDAARARQALRSRGAPVPRARKPSPDLHEALRARGVTRREAEVLLLIGRGLSNPEIADRLILSVRTVESHVSALLAKLDAESRAGLIALSLSLDDGRSA